MKLLVIRGDLQSHAGYSAAIRAYCGLLKEHFDYVVGVDIHFAAERPFEPFPFPVVSEAEARYRAAAADATLALSITTPNHYARLPHAVNIGLTFWETDQWPTGDQKKSPWIAVANRMDGLWAASSHSKEVFRSLGIRVPIQVVPWPVESPDKIEAGIPQGEIYRLDQWRPATARLAWLGERPTRGLRRLWAPLKKLTCGAANRFLAHLKSSADTIPGEGRNSFLFVAQDVPRKGLLLLLSEWLEFKRRPEAAAWNLILKTTPYNTEVPRFDFILRFARHVSDVKRQLGVKHSDIHIWTSDLSGPDYNRLVANTFAGLAPSFGEGFCGPAALGLALGKPVIASRHTAFCDYFREDYPYLFECRPVRTSFIDDAVGLYAPHSSWHVPKPGALADAFSRVVANRENHEGIVANAAKDYLASWCGPNRVGRIIARELSRLSGGSSQRLLPAKRIMKKSQEPWHDRGEEIVPQS